MNVADFRAQLEEEFAWRIEEILFLQNQCSDIEREERRDRFRRAVVLLLYSNYEGYCRFGLNMYVSVINQEDITCKDVNYAIAAASLNDVFTSLRDGSGKVKEFRHAAPDDTKLHRFGREKEFIEHLVDFSARKVRIPDKVVDTESNLRFLVLRKILYRLGLPYEQFGSHEANIELLVNLRNKIAHGQTKQGIRPRQYEQLRQAAFDIMRGITSVLTQAVYQKWYLADHI